MFLNRKVGLTGKKKKKEQRFVRNVGLGFKTPREVWILCVVWCVCVSVSTMPLELWLVAVPHGLWDYPHLSYISPPSPLSQASDGLYIDKKCPFTGNVSIRGRILTGIVKSKKMKRTIVIRRDYLHYIKKYKRYEKRHNNLSCHLSPCFRSVSVRVVLKGILLHVR